MTSNYTPSNYAEGSIVSYVLLYVSSFCRWYIQGLDNKVLVNVSPVVHISVTTYQKAFIFGP